MRADAKRKKLIRKRRRALWMLFAVVIVFCGILSYNKIQLKQKSNTYQEQLKELNQHLKDEEKRKDDLEAYKAYTQTQKYVEEEARDKLGLAYPDEIIFEAEGE
ncbi:MAG: septum formation initiator family protein [Lachnospiraceae bacterium]|nr:septum formation initiator family protein [Lachnospiraceae bacterium]